MRPLQRQPRRADARSDGPPERSGGQPDGGRLGPHVPRKRPGGRRPPNARRKAQAGRRTPAASGPQRSDALGGAAEGREAGRAAEGQWGGCLTEPRKRPGGRRPPNARRKAQERGGSVASPSGSTRLRQGRRPGWERCLTERLDPPAARPQGRFLRCPVCDLVDVLQAFHACNRGSNPLGVIGSAESFVLQALGACVTISS